jgi:hypothetical protein
MNKSNSDGQAEGQRSNARIPVAMMLIAIGMMFVVLFSVSSRPHGGTVLGMIGTSVLGHRLLILVGIAFELVGLVLTMRAVVAARKE